MAQLSVNGATLAYDEEGQGAPPFVFVHGWAGDRSFWQPQVEDLARNHRCLSIDLRGCGESEKTPPYDMLTAADDVAAVMRDQGLGPAIVAGHDLGGLIALVVGDRHPDLVLGTVMADPPLDGAARGAMGGLAAQIREADSMEPARPFFERFFVEGVSDEVREHVEARMLGCDPEVASGQLSDNGYFAQNLGRLLQVADQRPFMALWGDHPPGDPDRLRQITRFLRQEPVPGGGHFFQLQRPGMTTALLRAFVDDVLRDPRISAPSEGAEE